MWGYFTCGGWFVVVDGYVVGGVLGLIMMLLTHFVGLVQLGELGYLNKYFVIDYFSVVFGMLTLTLCCVLYMVGVRNIWIYVSIAAALISYVSVNFLFFWFFYELSIICALVLLLCESPYPERYSAGWYFLGYVVVSSVPLLFGLVVLSLLEGTMNMGCWGVGGNWRSVVWLVCIVFMSKIPVPPFHVWLPLVHAEASSPTSIILSGYLMKLGVLGLVRLGGGVLNSDVMVCGVLLMCTFGLLFMVSSYLECDAKRWLAMMSLFHILVPIVLCVYGSPGFEIGYFLYCFGHGLAAGMAFILIWWGYGFVGSRSWSLINCVVGGVLGLQLMSGLVFFSVAGFPPTVNFVCEIMMLISVGSDGVLLLVLCLFVFGGSLLAFIVLGGVVVSEGVVGGVSRCGYDGYLFSIMMLGMVGYFTFYFF